MIIYTRENAKLNSKDLLRYDWRNNLGQQKFTYLCHIAKYWAHDRFTQVFIHLKTKIILTCYQIIVETLKFDSTLKTVSNNLHIYTKWKYGLMEYQSYTGLTFRVLMQWISVNRQNNKSNSNDRGLYHFLNLFNLSIFHCFCKNS